MVTQYRDQHSVWHRMALGGQADGEHSDGGADMNAEWAPKLTGGIYY